jgi:Big-like domain-containing protein
MGTRGAGLVFALLAAIWGCAQPGLPPGGPPDTTPPAVVQVSPDSEAVGVPITAPIRITFTEKVDEKSLEQALWVTPGGAAKPRIDFHGNAVEIKLGRAFPESTTLGVLITTLLRDRLVQAGENRIAKPIHWIFSTGSTIWPGRVRGSLEKVGLQPGQGVVLIGLYEALGDSIPDPTSADPIAITEPDSSGRFDLIGLPVTGRQLWLFALYDRNGNRAIAGQGEFAGAEPDSIVLTSDRPEMDVKLRLVDPQAPGTIEGTLVSVQADTIAKWVELTALGRDSATVAPRRSEVGKKGTFSLSGLRPGTYRLAVFCDFNGNNQHDPDEPASPYGDIDLAPGAKRQVGNWRVSGCLP